MRDDPAGLEVEEGKRNNRVKEPHKGKGGEIRMKEMLIQRVDGAVFQLQEEGFLFLCVCVCVLKRVPTGEERHAVAVPSAEEDNIDIFTESTVDKRGSFTIPSCDEFFQIGPSIYVALLEEELFFFIIVFFIFFSISRGSRWCVCVCVREFQSAIDHMHFLGIFGDLTGNVCSAGFVANAEDFFVLENLGVVVVAGVEDEALVVGGEAGEGGGVGDVEMAVADDDGVEGFVLEGRRGRGRGGACGGAAGGATSGGDDLPLWIFSFFFIIIMSIPHSVIARGERLQLLPLSVFPAFLHSYKRPHRFHFRIERNEVLQAMVKCIALQVILHLRMCQKGRQGRIEGKIKKGHDLLG